MADRMATTILLGGQIPRTLAGALTDVIQEEQVSLDYDAPVFLPTTADDLLGALQDGHLSLTNAQCAWGRFDILEDFLITHRIPFTRYTEAKYEYSAEVVYFRRGMTHPRTFLTTPDHEVIIRESDITPIIDILRHACATPTLATTRHILTGVIRRLRRETGQTIPALSPLTFA